MTKDDTQTTPTPAAGLLLFAVVLVCMLTIGVVVQGLHMQGGLIVTQFVVILLPAVVFRKIFSAHWPSLTKLGLHPKWLAWVGVTAALIGIGANVVTGLVVELVPALQDMAQEYEEMVTRLLWPDDPLLAVAGIFAVCVAAPFCEEFLFRGTILTAQAQGARPWAWLVVSNGLLFSLLHINPFGFLALAVVGAFFAHLTLLTRSLWPAIFAHAVLNTVNGVLTPYLLRDSAHEAVKPEVAELLIGCAVIVPLVVFAWSFGARRLQSEVDV